MGNILQDPGDEALQYIQETGLVNVVKTDVHVDFSKDVSVNDEMREKGLSCVLCNQRMAQIYNDYCRHKLFCYHCYAHNFVSSGIIQCPIQGCNVQLTILR